MRALILSGLLLAATAGAQTPAPVVRVPVPADAGPQAGATPRQPAVPPPDIPGASTAYGDQPAPPPEGPPPTSSYGHQPPGAAEAIAGLTSQPSTRTAFTIDRDMLSAFLGGHDIPAELQSVAIENFRYREPAFYVPEAMDGLRSAYEAAGWKHLVEQHATRREEASPTKPITDLWLHFRGSEIDHMAVLVRAPRSMSLVEVSGTLKPLDLLKLSGKFGIPKVDPDVVMIPDNPVR